MPRPPTSTQEVGSPQEWWECYTPMLATFLTQHSRFGLCLVDASGGILENNQGFVNLLKYRELPESSLLQDWLQEESKAVWTECLLRQTQEHTAIEAPAEQETLHLTLLGRMKTRQPCICHVQSVPHRRLLLFFEPVDETIGTLEVISQLNNNMTNLTRELARKNKELEETNATILKIMNTDPLTGIANRRAIQKLLSHHFSLAIRQKTPLSVILCDLDHFKQVNDNFGHAAGDEVLVAFSQLLEHCSRHEDGVARWGGEEFLMVLPMTHAQDASYLAERICRETRQLHFHRYPQQQTVSLGIAELHPTDTMDILLKRADEALYVAKSSGRDRFCLFPFPSPEESSESQPIPYEWD